MKTKYRKNIIIESEKVCRKCGGIAECRQHSVITDKMLKQPFYYSRWYMCRNRDCVTTMFSFKEDEVQTPKGIRREQFRDEVQQMELHFNSI